MKLHDAMILILLFILLPAVVNALFSRCESERCSGHGQCYYDYDRSHRDTDVYYCACNIGWLGKHCEIRLSFDPCFSSPCQNNGTCSTGPNGNYTCDCPDDYAGQNCDTVKVIAIPLSIQRVDLCSQFPSPCENNGTCVENGSDYTCDCEGDFTGRNCETIIDPCSSNPCLNGGSCNLNASTDHYFCSCREGFTGSHCETPENLWEAVTEAAPHVVTSRWLMESGKILDRSWFPYRRRLPVYLQTTANYQGDVANTTEILEQTSLAIVDPCLSEPCQHHGTCVRDEDDYTCACQDGFTGRNCETTLVLTT